MSSLPPHTHSHNTFLIQPMDLGMLACLTCYKLKAYCLQIPFDAVVKTSDYGWQLRHSGNLLTSDNSVMHVDEIWEPLDKWGTSTHSAHI